MTLTDTNESTRNSAKNSGINGTDRVVATPQFDTLKSGLEVIDNMQTAFSTLTSNAVPPADP